jgi:hypothetical protein
VLYSSIVFSILCAWQASVFWRGSLARSFPVLEALFEVPIWLSGVGITFTEMLHSFIELYFSGPSHAGDGLKSGNGKGSIETWGGGGATSGGGEGTSSVGAEGRRKRGRNGGLFSGLGSGATSSSSHHRRADSSGGIEIAVEVTMQEEVEVELDEFDSREATSGAEGTRESSLKRREVWDK